MHFPLVTHGGRTFRLLLIEPHWRDAFEVTHRFDANIGEGRTGLEERRPARAEPLLAIKYGCSPYQIAADDWKKGVAVLGKLPVAVPIWVDALPVELWNERIYDAQHVVNYDPDTGDFSLYEAANVPVSPAYPYLAPLMLGRWQERPSAVLKTSTMAGISIEVQEASPWSWRIGVRALAGGWSSVPNWVDSLEESSEYPLEVLRMGTAREPALDRVNVSAKWGQEGTYSFTSRAEIRQHLGFWVARKGPWESWSPVPVSFRPGSDTEATPYSYAARFGSETLTLKYKTGARADARVSLRQEILSPTRVQALPGEAYLYKLTYQHDAAHPELRTTWSAPLALPEGSYEPCQIGSQDITRSLKPQDEKAEATFALEEGGILADWIRARLFGWVSLSVWACNPEDPVGSRGDPLFHGVLKSVAPDGNQLKAEARLFGSSMDRKILEWVYGPRCNVCVFSSGCGLSEEGYRSIGTISPARLSADRLTLTVPDATGWGGPAYVEGWFVGGLIRTGSARCTQISTVLQSAMDGANLVLKLSRPLWADMISGSGQTVWIVPGCDGQGSTCRTKFVNFDNFRGMEFIPEFIETPETSMPKAKK